MKSGKQLPNPPRVKPPKDQLLVHDGLTMSVQKKRRFPEILIRLLITICGSIGTVGVLQGFFQFPITLKPLFLFIIALTVIMRCIRLISPKVGFASILTAFASIPLLLMKFRSQAVIGAGSIYHTVRARILWRIEFQPFEADTGDWTEGQCVQLVFILFIIAMTALMEYSDVLLTHPQSSMSGFWIRLLITFPFLECGLYFGIETYSICVFFIVIFWLGTLAVSRRKPSSAFTEKQGTSAVLQQAFDTENEYRFSTHEPGAAIMLLAALILTGAAVHISAGYSRTTDLDRKRDDIRNWYRNLTIEDFTGLLDNLYGDIGINVITDEIDLHAKSDLHFDGSPVLHMEIGAAAVPDDYYLRGIVRSEYTGSSWGIPTGAYRAKHKLFRKLTTENRMPQTIFHSDHVDELRTSDGKFPVVHCDVTALNEARINFLPYQSIYDIGTQYRYDIETELGDTEEYSFWIMNNARLDWEKFSANEAPSGNELISEYEAFAEEQYLRLPDTEAVAQLREQVMPDMPADSLPLNSRLDAIRDYIWARAEYTMQPGAQPADRDFVEYFLNEGHKGYCTHYASAAVLLCRMCGIPARYCEGYALTLNDFAKAKIDGDYSIDIPDYQAHAWAEIYVKGYGWIPYEFTETVTESWHNYTPEETPETTMLPVTTTAAPPVSTAALTTTTVTMVSSSQQYTDVVEEGNGISLAAFKKILKILLIILVIAAVFLLYYILHRLITGKRQRAMQSSNPNEAANAAYTFIVLLLHIQGIDQQKLSHDEFASETEKKCKLLPAGKLSHAFTIQQAAVFSRNGIAHADAKVICKTANQLANAMYRNANPLKKLWLRWGRHIIR